MNGVGSLRPIFAITLLISSSTLLAQSGRLINGKPVEPGTFKEVIRIRSNGAGCTATVVGPRVIVTASHCADNGAKATFSIGQTQYEAKITRSPIYPGKDHDIAIGITDKDITGIDYASIGGKATVGLGITLLGYGCTNPGGGGGNDGILRYGDTAITGFTTYDMISRKAGGAALCFGDSGGPAFLIDNGKHLLLGVNSKGNISDTNYNTRTDITESTNFLKNFADQNTVEICGVNKQCGGDITPPAKPSCTLASSPSQIKLGQSLTLAWVITGQFTQASLDGSDVTLATGSKSLTPTSTGTFTPRMNITGPGGSNACETTYAVTPDIQPPVKPTCTLSATPDQIMLGESVTLELKTQGQVTAASIDGVSVPYPLGKRIVTPTQKGNFTTNGMVTGPGGSNACTASYTVDEEIGPLPETPNLAVVPVYCGDNVVLETKVSRICLAVLKKDTSTVSMKFGHVILITYSDTTKEVLPIIHRKMKPSLPGDLQHKEELTLYANTSVPSKDYMVLDTRKATLTLMPPGRDNIIPTALEGRTAKGSYFLVERLTPYNVSE